MEENLSKFYWTDLDTCIILPSSEIKDNFMADGVFLSYNSSLYRSENLPIILCPLWGLRDLGVYT